MKYDNNWLFFFLQGLNCDLNFFNWFGFLYGIFNFTNCINLFAKNIAIISLSISVPLSSMTFNIFYQEIELISLTFGSGLALGGAWAIDVANPKPHYPPPWLSIQTLSEQVHTHLERMRDHVEELCLANPACTGQSLAHPHECIQPDQPCLAQAGRKTQRNTMIWLKLPH